jgi:alpha-amylase/alpha-mannosidase (GH57 family)
MRERYICIHGHFYQPPRENPWLEVVEQQDSAAPYHDWNERITAECYGPNAVSRMVDDADRITALVNNYARISFNFGPTLLSWLQERAPEVYAAVLAADLESRTRFSGHGSALAQAYNHAILPLCTTRDKRTQVRWGLRDFERRFGRRAEGLWLPETAADTETLEIVAQEGVAFTVLAPSQARRVRRLGGRNWTDVAGGRVDPTRAYRAALPSGRSLALFFYDGPISRAVAFEGLLHRGEYLAGRLGSAFVADRDWDQLVHIATDGETYGHHHPFGNQALTYALEHIEKAGLARLTNYGEYLERHPPTHEAEIFEPAAWSCVHGVGRWESDCGCNSGGHAGWNQAWRGPLRDALDALRDELAVRFARRGGELFKDAWKARDAYVDVMLDRSPPSVERFLAAQVRAPLDAAARAEAIQLLEMQRHAQLMYTSCGWFFDEVSGIETVQVMRYAAAALQLAQAVFGEDLEPGFVEKLALAPSNVARHRNAASVWASEVKPSVVDSRKLAAHYAISSLFETYPPEARVYSYEVVREEERSLRTGRLRLLVGHGLFTSAVTGLATRLSYGVVHFGDHNLNAGVREYRGEAAFEEMVAEAAAAFQSADLAAVIRAMDRHFGTSSYSLRTLFRDEQRRALATILESTLSDVAAIYAQVHANHAPLMRFLADLGVPQPRALQTTAEFVTHHELRVALRAEEPAADTVREMLDAAQREGLRLETAELAYLLEKRLERLADLLHEDPLDLALVDQAHALALIARTVPWNVKLWRVQNVVFDLLQGVYAEQEAREDAESRGWCRRFAALAELLSLRVPDSR